MLFAVKNHLGPTLLLLVVFVTAALGLRAALGLTWQLDIHADVLLLGLAGMAASDGLLHGLGVLLLGEPYRQRYRQLVEYFRPQRAGEIVAGGLLAGGEELIFRGVLLGGLRTLAGWPAAAAVGGTALVFGLLHVIPGRRDLWVLAPWAVWEGVLLGTVFVVGESLLVVGILHVLHDVIGFSLFAVQRRTGWLLG